MIGLLIEQGGAVVIALLFCSVIALGVVLERLGFWLRWARHKDQDALETVLDSLRGGDRNKALRICAQSKDLRLGVIFAGLSEPEDKQQVSWLKAGENYVHQVSYGQSLLSTIVTLAPLLGILGTILGIIQSFDILTGVVPSVDGVTAGVAKALITTAVGLFVAIGALIPLNLFRSWSNQSVVNLEVELSRLEQTLKGRG